MGAERPPQVFQPPTLTSVPTSTVLVVYDRADGEHSHRSLEATGWTVEVASSVSSAKAMLVAATFDVIVLDIDDATHDGLDFVGHIRRSARNATSSVIFLAAVDTAGDDPDQVIRMIDAGVDDYVRKPLAPGELTARVRARRNAPRKAEESFVRHTISGLLTEARLQEELVREIGRSARSGRRGCLAALDVAERSSVAAQLGPRADADMRLQVSALAAAGAGEFDLLSNDGDGRLLVLMPETEPNEARARLVAITDNVTRGSITADGEAIHVTPVVGFAVYGPQASDPAVVVDRALAAVDVAMDHLDLQPVEWEERFELQNRAGPKVKWTTRVRQSVRGPLQVFITFDIGVVLPFIIYLLLDRAGFNIVPVVYVIVVIALLITAAVIWTEGILALKTQAPPDEPIGEYPPASAIIAAYLPNEAATVIQTVEAFLRTDYPGDFQVVLAYNTPQPMPIEDLFKQMAERDPRFLPYRVLGSTSKAQNVNAALGQVTGEFVGVFDADHHPARDAFRRAWRWISNGYDVVQGHCMVRNGDTSLVSRTVAVEFESIYAVSHPGRAKLHTFGIFGGSNGYWRTEVLRRVRMHGFMLTEDIDSSLRVIESGGKIASDPGLISEELAPTTLGALWNQRMRWAQGWFQVSRKHLMRGWKSDQMTFRQKFGFTFLLGWREVYPWLSLQVVPILAFFAVKAGSIGDLNWFVPFFVLTTLFTLSVGPGQTYFAYRLAAPEMHRRKKWFIMYLFVSSLFYTEMKNVIGRVAQIKELTGDRQWKVTPRTTASELPREVEPAR